MAKSTVKVVKKLSEKIRYLTAEVRAIDDFYIEPMNRANGDRVLRFVALAAFYYNQGVRVTPMHNVVDWYGTTHDFAYVFSFTNDGHRDPFHWLPPYRDLWMAPAMREIPKDLLVPFKRDDDSSSMEPFELNTELGIVVSVNAEDYLFDELTTKFGEMCERIAASRKQRKDKKSAIEKIQKAGLTEAEMEAMGLRL